MTESQDTYRPAASSDVIRDRFKAQRRRDTAPEMALRRELHRRGFRYRVDLAPIGGRRRADIVFTRVRVAVFVDGCFWHRCPFHGTSPRSNQDWWNDKLDRNVARDRDTDLRLQRAGWTVVRIWEHEDTVKAVAAVQEALTQGRQRCQAADGRNRAHRPGP